MIRIETTLLAAVLVCVGCSSSTTPTPTDMKDQRPAMSTTAQPAPAPKMTQEQIMAAMKEASTPSEAHTALKAYVGTWKAEVKEWMPGNPEPRLTKGISINKLILGGRFLEQKYVSTAKGEKFEGQGIIGYDNLAKKYTSTWIDTMTTSQFIQDGTYDPSTKIIAMTGSMTCPMTKKDMPAKTTLSMVDKNSYTFEMFAKDPETGKEFKALEIVYTKAGAGKIAAKTTTPEKK